MTSRRDRDSALAVIVDEIAGRESAGSPRERPPRHITSFRPVTQVDLNLFTKITKRRPRTIQSRQSSGFAYFAAWGVDRDGSCSDSTKRKRVRALQLMRLFACAFLSSTPLDEPSFPRSAWERGTKRKRVRALPLMRSFACASCRQDYRAIQLLSATSRWAALSMARTASRSSLSSGASLQ